MQKIFGIDLGTTYSCIAYIDDAGKPMVVKNAEGELTTPSVVFFDDGNNIEVGASAKENSKLYPDQVVSFIKRSIGKPNSDQTINGKTMSPSEISSYILKKVVGDAIENLREEGKLGENEEIKDVVITCPAYFGINERTATKTAGEYAGLNVLQIINEPTAAAIAYGTADDSQEKTVLVYDLGGGTFDITMIHIKPGEIKVICTSGDHNLGGKDWDDSLLVYLDDEFKAKTGTSESILDDPETLQEVTGITLRLYYSTHFGDSLNAMRLQVDSLDTIIPEGEMSTFYTSVDPKQYYNPSAQPLARKAFSAKGISAEDSTYTYSDNYGYTQSYTSYWQKGWRRAKFWWTTR